MTNTSSIEARPELKELIKELCAEHREIILLSVCTLDGFSIESYASSETGMESDKVAAIASSLCALSNSSSIQFTDEEFDITIIESAGGNSLFCRTTYLETACVVTLSSRTNLTLAQARFALKRLSKSIAQVS